MFGKSKGNEGETGQSKPAFGDGLFGGAKKESTLEKTEEKSGPLNLFGNKSTSSSGGGLFGTTKPPSNNPFGGGFKTSESNPDKSKPFGGSSTTETGKFLFSKQAESKQFETSKPTENKLFEYSKPAASNLFGANQPASSNTFGDSKPTLGSTKPHFSGASGNPFGSTSSLMSKDNTKSENLQGSIGASSILKAETESAFMSSHRDNADYDEKMERPTPTKILQKRQNLSKASNLSEGLENYLIDKLSELRASTFEDYLRSMKPYNAAVNKKPLNDDDMEYEQSSQNKQKDRELQQVNQRSIDNFINLLQETINLNSEESNVKINKEDKNLLGFIVAISKVL